MSTYRHETTDEGTKITHILQASLHTVEQNKYSPIHTSIHMNTTYAFAFHTHVRFQQTDDWI